MSNVRTFSFGKLPTLTTIYWSSDKIKQSWKWSDRSMESVMQRFIDLNQKNLSYLGIEANIESVNGKPSIKLSTSKYIGAIPIKSPMNGKAVGDLIVTGRYGENAEEIITLLDSSIKPEYSDEFQLVQNSQIAPPIFIECCKYIDTYIDAEHFKWQKFSNIIKAEHQPKGSTLWGDYAHRNALNPLEYSIFKNKCNTLTLEHPEWAQLNYVLKKAIQEIESPRSPIRTRSIYASRKAQLRIKLKEMPIQHADWIKIHMSDPHVIKHLKKLANIILNNCSNEKLAWRMDYAEFFERYVQYLIDDIAKKKGARSINNPHYTIGTYNRPAWGLQYLEPDLVLQKGTEQIVIDAKYKSHIFNWNNDSDELKDTFRHDFHQVLAYCSITSSSTKRGMIIYPFNDFCCHKMKVNNPIVNSEANIYLVGIPIDKTKIEDVKEKLSNIVSLD